MEQPAEPIGESDQALVHQFIRLFGRAPSEDERTTYAGARARMALRHPRRVRRSLARLIARM